MDIDCLENSFRDIAVGAARFYEFTNVDWAWQDPNGNKLIVGVIDKSVLLLIQSKSKIKKGVI